MTTRWPKEKRRIARLLAPSFAEKGRRKDLTCTSHSRKREGGRKERNIGKKKRGDRPILVVGRERGKKKREKKKADLTDYGKIRKRGKNG